MTPVGRSGARCAIKHSQRSKKWKNDRHAVDIKRIIRPVRGEAQARMVEGEDGCYYIAKFAGNPQGNRTLANEWVVQSILSFLNISTPPLRVLRLPEQLRNDDLYFSVDNRRISVDSEWHLGSLCPVNPETTAIFDFLPMTLMQNVANLDDFAKIFAVDRWVYQTDRRQAVFVRKERSTEGKCRFQAHFIDHGQSFSGSLWELRDAHLPSLYSNRPIYTLIDAPTICDRIVSQIENLTIVQLLSPLSTLPTAWLTPSDQRPLRQLIEKLHSTRRTLRKLVMSQITALTIHANNKTLPVNSMLERTMPRNTMGTALTLTHGPPCQLRLSSSSQ